MLRRQELETLVPATGAVIYAQMITIVQHCPGRATENTSLDLPVVLPGRGLLQATIRAAWADRVPGACQSADLCDR